MNRIHIIGSPGSGKTSLAQKVAQRLEIPHVELDDLHWEENWQQAELDVFRQRVRQALSGEVWVVDGNYSKVRDIVWERAQLVVWLDYPLRVSFWRLLRRSLSRWLTGELLWGRNRESFRALFFSSDSLILYQLKTHRAKRRRYEALMQDPASRSIQFLRLHSPRQTRHWLATLDEKKDEVMRWNLDR
jgi:adenylate kinase family enzyme